MVIMIMKITFLFIPRPIFSNIVGIVIIINISKYMPTRFIIETLIASIDKIVAINDNLA